MITDVGTFDDLDLAVVLDAADVQATVEDGFDYLRAVIASRFATVYRMLDDVEVSL